MRLATIAAAFVLFSVPLAIEAQQPGKVYHVGILTNKASDPAEARLWQAFRSGLRERGWIEGRNILIEFREAEGNLARLPELAADLARLKVDLILAKASTFVQPAKAATSSIPIVFVSHADPVETGHVASLARPGGNITGLTIVMTDLAPKGLEVLISAVPMAKRIAVLWSPDTPSHIPALKAVEEAGRTLGVQLQAVGARTAAELEGAFAAMARARAQAVLVLGSALFLAERQRVAELAIKHRLPTMSNLKDVVEAGGLVSYSPNWDDLYRSDGQADRGSLESRHPLPYPGTQGGGGGRANAPGAVAARRRAHGGGAGGRLRGDGPRARTGCSGARRRTLPR